MQCIKINNHSSKQYTHYTIVKNNALNITTLKTQGWNKFNETSCMPPSALSAPTPTPLQREPTPARAASQAPAPTPARDPLPIMPSFDSFEPSHTMSDLERKADDIIANFRARHSTGFDRWM